MSTEQGTRNKEQEIPPTPQGGHALPLPTADAAGAPGRVSSLGLSGRVEAALASNGIATLEALTALTARELRARPKVGAKTIREVSAALSERGLSLRAQPEEPDKQKDPPEFKRASDLWQEAYVEVFDRKPVWQFTGRAPTDYHRRREWAALAMSTEPDGWEDLLRAAMLAYLCQCAAGQHWTQKQDSTAVATTATFTRELARWLEVARGGGPAVSGSPAKPSARDLLGEIETAIADRGVGGVLGAFASDERDGIREALRVAGGSRAISERGGRYRREEREALNRRMAEVMARARDRPPREPGGAVLPFAAGSTP